MKTSGYAAHSATTPLEPFQFERREVGSNDVAMDILYCGVCHSDLHTARNDWGGSKYPVVPGHEIVGRVTDVGHDVKRFKTGDLVAVGCMVDSCQHCDQCLAHNEQYCRNGGTFTYNSADPHTGRTTFGGYSKHLVVQEQFVLRIPDGLDIAKAAPLLCAGITTYSPLRACNVGPDSRVGVVGLGGLGHMAVKLASAMGATVTVISRSADKESDAHKLGAHHFLLSTDSQAMQKSANSFDFIIDTIPNQHDINPYLPLLDFNGTFTLVGQVGPLSTLNSIPLIMGRRRIMGSLIGGIKETQEMLDFCAEKQVLPECEMIKIADINEAYERMIRSDVHYRFVIDMSLD